MTTKQLIAAESRMHACKSAVTAALLEYQKIPGGAFDEDDLMPDLISLTNGTYTEHEIRRALRSIIE
jgi:hypothetical protein